MIIEMTGMTNISAFKKLEDESKKTVLKELKVRGRITQATRTIDWSWTWPDTETVMPLTYPSGNSEEDDSCNGFGR